MKSEKFIQLFDADKKPILSDKGVLNYDKRSKTPTGIIKSLRDANKLPKEAVYFAIHKTILKSIQKVTTPYKIDDY